MEFKFRSIDGQALSTNTSPSSSMSYFAEQALRAGYSGPDFERTTDLVRSSSHVREAVRRELEKQQIREEIIAEEMARRRVLEAEVRRELSLEREIAMRRADGMPLFPGTASSSSSAMLFESRMPLLHQCEGRSLEERLALSLEERVCYEARRGIGAIETLLPFQRNAERKITLVEPQSEVTKEKVVFLAKPERSLSGSKRKAVSPPAAGAIEFPSVGLKKKPKEEWSCAACQLSATSERALNDHLQGKKHKARETAIRAQKTGKNYAIGLLPKKTGNSIKHAENADNNQNLLEEKLVRESLHMIKCEEVLLRKKSSTVDVKQINELRLKVNQDTDESRNKIGDSLQNIQKNGDHKKKRFKFWCEMCQIGAFSEMVFNSHKRGKKHVARIQELNLNSGSVLTAQVDEASRKENDPDVVAKCGKEEIPDNIDGAAAEATVENRLSVF